jgi:hypothetical protein
MLRKSSVLIHPSECRAISQQHRNIVVNPPAIADLIQLLTLLCTFHLIPTAVACGQRVPRMFHGSGRYRAPVDSDDSYTSSSGEESLSDSPKRESPDRYVDDTTESHRVRLVRGALDTAYRSVAVIEAPRKDISQEGQTPWKDLGNALKTITDNGGDARVRAAMDVDTLSREYTYFRRFC